MANKEHIPVIDRTLARAASAATRIGTRLRPVGNLYMHTDPRVHRLPYRPVDEFVPGRGTWAAYPGDPNGTKWPVQKWYKQVARTDIDGDKLLETREQILPGSRPAIAWKIGKATVAGVLSEGQFEEVLEKGYYDTLLGGGKHKTALGFVYPAQRQLIVAPGAAAVGEVMDLKTEYPPYGIIY
jgi:hypothetical protein